MKTAIFIARNLEGGEILVIISGVIKQFELCTIKYHKNCHTIIKEDYCSKCNRYIINEFGREYYAYLLLRTTEDTRIRTTLRETALRAISERMGFSIRTDLYDKLKKLGPNTNPTWWNEWLQIKKFIEQSVNDYYIKPSRRIGLSGNQESELTRFVADKVVSISERSALEVQKFVEGSQSELLSVTRKLLFNYVENFDDQRNEPFVFYRKVLRGVRLEIGIRAVAETYGKAYHVFMDVNGRRQYPAKPVIVGGRAHKEVWVYRIYHTKGWKEKLAKMLRKLLSLEARAVETSRV